MEEALRNIISTIADQAQQFRVNDMLVDVNAGSGRHFTCEGDKINLSDFPARIIREQKAIERENGVNVFCSVYGSVQHEFRGKNVTSPILIEPTQIEIDKVRGLVKLTTEDSGLILNPFLRYLFIHHYGLEESFLSTLEDSLDQKLEDALGNAITLLKEKGFNVDQTMEVCGNFHHHRFALYKDLDKIKVCDDSPSLERLFGFSNENNALDQTSKLLFPADSDHLKVFSEFQANDLAVAGPPGTGKSQMTTNIVAKALNDGTPTLLVSEKRTALSVIERKLSEFGLNRLAFVYPPHRAESAFIEQLKANWLFFEEYTNEHINHLENANNKLNNLQFWLDILNQENLIGGVSYSRFKELSADVNHAEGSFYHFVPSMPTFEESKEIIDWLYDQNIAQSIGFLRQTIISQNSAFDVKKQLQKLQLRLESLQERFGFRTMLELEGVIKKAALTQILENEVYRSNQSLFKPNSRKQKSFLAKYRKLNTLSASDNESKLAAHWRRTPEKEELERILELIKLSGWLSKRKAARIWKSLSKADVSVAEELINKEIIRQQFIAEHQDLLIEFCDLGIEGPEINAPLIKHLIDQYLPEEWDRLSALDKDEVRQFTGSHSELSELRKSIHKWIQLPTDRDLKSTLSDIIEVCDRATSVWEKVQKITNDTWQLIGVSNDKKEFIENLFHSHWSVFIERYPMLSDFKPSSLEEKVESILADEQIESQLFAKEILQFTKDRFDNAHQLLQTPATKLKPEEKERKKLLRKGKSILVKEFSKTRQHWKIRELLESEAREWIRILLPGLFCNGSQLATSFPFEQGIFEVGLFDESSQIPAFNALGAIHRCNRFIVTGDEHQMGPSSIFGGGEETQDLLSLANYHLQRVKLKHHYRSQDPQLIRFSNSHFYNDELVCFPTFNAPKQAIMDNYDGASIYHERTNVLEAKHIAKKIKSLLPKSESFGVVTFSEEQLSIILDELDDQSRQRLQDRIENDCFVKSVENVQGDECDHLLIGFTFGKNKDGKFLYQFGPMSTISGRNRFNVLLTRARKTISFYSSVRSNDFKLTDNESIELIRKWFVFLESIEEIELPTFPMHLKPQVSEDQLSFENIHETVQNAVELKTIYAVLKTRGWKIQFI